MAATGMDVHRAPRGELMSETAPSVDAPDAPEPEEPGPPPKAGRRRPLVIGALTEELYGAAAGCIALLLASFYFPFVDYAAYILSETPFTLALLGRVIVTVAGPEPPFQEAAIALKPVPSHSPSTPA